MSTQHSANWPESGRMLKDALEEYRRLKGYHSPRRALEDFANFLPGRDGHELSIKQAERYLDGLSIPPRQVEHCVVWLHQKARMLYGWLKEWLEYTDYPRPGELLACVCFTEGNRQKLYASVRKNDIPSLRGHLWGHFLGRTIEMETAIQWADHGRHPVAVLWGFGGNGKTTIQLKVGEDFVYGSDCPLRWPFDSVVWVSARDYPRGQPGLLDIQRKIVETFVKNTDPVDIGLGSVPPAWLKQESEKYLKKKRVLVLLDNFETISQPNQEEILKFFSWLSGSSQILISSRYSLDMGNVAHVLIPVEGLQPEQAKILIQHYLKAMSIPQDEFDPHDLKRLAEITWNNPKTIIIALGIVTSGRISLPRLLDNIANGSPEADEVFDEVIGQAWKEILDEPDKAVLMAKAMFSQPVSQAALGRIANVSGSKLSQSIHTLQNISFFERPHQRDTRIRAHQLSHDFAQRILHDHPDFERQAEERWWSEYARDVVDQARRATYTDLQARPELGDDITNVLEHLERHLREETPYSVQAAELFAGQNRLGYALFQLGWWDEILRIAEICLKLGIKLKNPRLIGECALTLIAAIYRERNELNMAEMYKARAIEQNVSLNDHWLQATIEKEQAWIYRRQGLFKAAKQALQNALDAYLKSGDAHDIASIFSTLGGNIIDFAVVNLDEAVYPEWQENKERFEAIECFHQSEYYWNQVDFADPEGRFDAFNMRAWRAVDARLRGDLEQSRHLFNGCLGQFRSSMSVARLYRELALVEHLIGNKELAHSYEERGLDLQRQLGIIDVLPPHNCYRIIERMKKEGRW